MKSLLGKTLLEVADEMARSIDTLERKVEDLERTIESLKDDAHYHYADGQLELWR